MDYPVLCGTLAKIVVCRNLSTLESAKIFKMLLQCSLVLVSLHWNFDILTCKIAKRWVISLLVGHWGIGRATISILYWLFSVHLVLFPRHFASLDVREETISRIQIFRDYLHYHIKCAKAYMHTRMRARVRDFLKVLNRAKPENLNVEKKTAT